MTLSTIISTYEERFDKEFAYLDKVINEIPLVEMHEYLRQFAADLAREAFAATAIPMFPLENTPFKEGFNDALSGVEARQREFIGEQQ